MSQPTRSPRKARRPLGRIGIGLLVVGLMVPAAPAFADSYDCYPFCASKSSSKSSSSRSSSSREDYRKARAERDAAREHRRMIEARRKENRDAQRRADSKLRKLERQLKEGARSSSSSSSYGYGHRWGHGSNDGQAGAHCMYGADGKLIYAPEGARCAPQKGRAIPGAGSAAPGQTGCIQGDCKNGEGTYVWSDGSRYTGGFQNGLQHGHGTLAFTSGASYVGAWEQGTRTGLGTAIFPDGRVKAGRWKANRFVGEAPVEKATAQLEWPDLSRPASTVGGGERDYAVIVGIGEYAHVASIPGAKRNAVDWYRHLVKTVGVPSDRVSLLLDEDATREEIELAAEEAASRVGRKGRLWFVFIGHGAPAAAGDDGLLIGFDAQQKARSLSARSLRRSALLETLEGSRADAIHVVLDACFSGRSGSGEQLVAGLQPLVVTSSTPTSDARTTLFTAAASDEYAGPLPGAARPAFSYLLLGGLRGWADGDADGRVSAGELHRYATATMRSTIRGRRQTPTLIGEEGVRVGLSPREAGPDVADLLLERHTPASTR